MIEYPHVPAAFINAIREEGTKEEACDYLQKQWNETCALGKKIFDLEAYISILEIQIQEYRNQDHPNSQEN